MSKRSIYTQAIHAGEEPDPTTKALSTPIYQTSTFVFSNAQEAQQVFAGEREGYVYTRWGNPTVAALERKVAALEGGEDGIATSSGMASITTALFSVAGAGDHIVAARALYGGTHHLFTKELPHLGLKISLVDGRDPEEIAEAIREETRAIYIETPGNPLLDLMDIRAVVEIARQRGLVTIADNTFATPFCQRPLDWGVDLVVHSATKYLGGHGDTIAGVIVGAKERIEAARVTTLRYLGSVLGPFDAWLILRGIHTLPLRMERHCANALALARFLETHPKVERVYYPGLESHPQHDVARRQMSAYGGMISFEVRGGVESGARLLDGVRLCTLAASLGDVRTLISHPASMTHAPHIVPPEERLAAGISDGLIRLSVGLEAPQDLIEDLEGALAQVGR